MTTCKPLHDRVLIRPHAKPMHTMGGLVLPDTGAKTPQAAQWQEGGLVVIGGDEPDVSGVVVAIGDGLVSPAVQVGEHVVFPPGKAKNVEIDGVRLLMLRERDLLAVLEPEM